MGELHILMGRAGSGLSQRQYGQIVQALRTSPNPLILLVPEQYTLQSELEIAALLGKPGFLQLEVLSPTRLRERVFAQAGGQTQVLIDERGKCMALRSILQQLAPQLQLYARAAQREGILTKLSELIGELKRSDVRSEHLRAASEALPPGPLKAKLADVALLTDAYAQALSGRFVDGEDATETFIQRIPQAPMLAGAEIWVDGFDVLPPQTGRMIVTLAQYATRVTLSATLDDDSPDAALFEAVRASVTRMEQMAQERGVTVRREKHPAPPHPSPGIAHLERTLFAPHPLPYKKKTRDIALYAAQNPHDEVQHAAVCIVALARERGYRWRDIAVVGDMRRYGRLCQTIFRQHGIPCFMDDVHPLTLHPIVQLLLSALDVVCKGWRTEDVLACIKTGCLKLTQEEAPDDERAEKARQTEEERAQEAMERLENYVLQYPVQGWRWKQPFTRGEEELEKLNLWRAQAVAPLEALENALHGRRSVRQMVTALWGLLETVDAHRQIEESMRDWTEKKRAQDAALAAQVWGALLDVFDQLVELMGETVMSPRELAQVLESGLNATRAGVIPPMGDAVPLGTPSRIKSGQVRAAIVLGMNDGVLPSAQSEESLFTSPERREAQRIAKRYMGADAKERSDVEQLLLYSVLSSPTEQLLVSMATADAAGAALRPSLLWSALTRAFPENDVRFASNLPDARTELTVREALSPTLARALRAHMDQKAQLSQDWLATWRFLRDEDAVVLARIAKGLRHSVHVSKLPEDTHWLLHTERCDATRLERFAKCPFSYFVLYGLRPQQRREAALDPRDVGVIVHDSIMRIAKAAFQEGRDLAGLTRAESDAWVEDLLKDALTNQRENLLESTGSTRARVREFMGNGRRALWRLIEQWRQSEFVSLGDEVPFGRGKPFPPLAVELSDGKNLWIEGQIDRLEGLQHNGKRYVRVIDYKTGNASFSLDEIYQGLAHQLTVYLAAALEGLEDAEPAGMYYYNMKRANEFLVTYVRDPENVDKELMKRARLNGLCLNDKEIIQSQGGKTPEYSIPVQLKKDETLYASSKVADAADFRRLIGRMRKNVRKSAEAMREGQISIEPAEKGRWNACTYCDCRGVCGFEELLGGKVRRFAKMKDSEVLLMLRAEEPEEEEQEE